MLTISVEDTDKNVTLRCAGRLVRGEEAAILCAALRHRERDIAVDLAGVNAIDAAGLGALISLQAAAVYLRLLNPSGVVRETLRVAHLDSVFEIHESRSLHEFSDEMKPVAVAI